VSPKGQSIRTLYCREMLRPESLAVAAGRPPHEPGQPVNTAISMTSTFRHDGDTAYVRDGDDTVRAFEAALGAIEHGQALGFSSGMAAVATILEGLRNGATVVAPTNAYFGVAEMLRQKSSAGRLTVRFCDIADTDETIEACVGADLLWLESPLNPTMAIADIELLTSAAHQAGAKVVCDNTFATVVCQQPLDFGVDVVMHSATKFIAGHSDVLMGATVTRDAALHEELSARRGLYGPTPSSMSSFLALRGLRTLYLRMERAQASAAVLAERLSQHHAVQRVRYPGLKTDAGHQRAAKQMRGGFGAMLAFDVVGDADAADAVSKRVQLITAATSLGGVETLIERRARYVGEQKVGTPANLLRLAVGIEHVEDLWADLDQALGAI
jgi:cystathionine gamma-synthase